MPDPDVLARDRLSDLVYAWVLQVFREFNIDMKKHVFAATTDGGSDIRRCCAKLCPSLWEWCIPHLLNCACVQAFGSSLDPRKGMADNDLARTVINAVRKVFESINKSKNKTAFASIQQRIFAGKPIKLINAQPQRWVGTAAVLQRVLELWPALELFYLEVCQKAFPLTDYKAEILELYSLLFPVAAIIKHCQSVQYPTGASGFLMVALLQLDELDVHGPLTIIVPKRKGIIEGGPKDTAARNAVSRAEILPVEYYEDVERRLLLCNATDLCVTAAETREKLCDAMQHRLFDPRYKLGCSSDKTGVGSSDLVYEQAMYLHPDLCDLRFVDKLASSAAYAETVKARIRNAILAQRADHGHHWAAGGGGGAAGGCCGGGDGLIPGTAAAVSGGTGGGPTRRHDYLVLRARWEKPCGGARQQQIYPQRGTAWRTPCRDAAAAPCVSSRPAVFRGGGTAEAV
ncbi:unnamed protein product [Phaeothamnion confervicola]